jgi:methylated-DNA-[protein]-cysteine S-methyltransferase
MTSTIYDSPIGPLTLVGDDAGLCMLSFPGRSPAQTDGDADRVHPVLGSAIEQLDEYFAGRRQAFELPLQLNGTRFQLKVWEALRSIPYGTTTSYGALARRVGVELERDTPEARAVAAVVARTPVAIIVPCHRVIGADGSLVGYGGGLHRKRALLDFESTGGNRQALADGYVQRQLALL